MSGLAQAITRGLNTNSGFNVQGVILIALAFVSEMDSGHIKEAAFFVTLIIWALVSFFTKGYQADVTVPDVPVDIDHDTPLEDILEMSRDGVSSDEVETLDVTGLFAMPMGLAPSAVRSISQKGLNLIKEFEGVRLKAYRCPAGVWTIGYGWTRGVKSGDVWTRAKAEQMLVEGVKPYVASVVAAIGNAKTSQNELDAMVSFTYNVGPANFRKSSVLRYHLQGKKASAADAFLSWTKAAGKTLPGLVRRRKAERALYLS